MRLYYSATSPYVRKVMAVAIATGLEKRIQKVTINPHQSPAELVAANPLSKVPCLVTEDGVALFDSPVICEYLDAVALGTLFPAGATRWRALKQQAIGDGILDAALLRRMEQGRPEEAARQGVMDRQRDVVARALDALETDLPADHLDIGTITLGCALGYLDFRFGHEPWRAGRPGLAAWYERMAARPEFERTAPPSS